MNSSNHWVLSNRLFQWNHIQALEEIQSIYDKQGFIVVSYVYGAVIVRNELFDSYKIAKQEKSQPIYSSTKWQTALYGSDIILPDGAALLTWWRVAHTLGFVSWVKKLTNLNGTDFFIQLLEHYLAQWPVNLVCYAVYDQKLWVSQWELLSKAGEWLLLHYGFTWTYAQDTHYTDNAQDRNREAMSQACDPQLPTIMMVCRGVPRQEIRSYEHRDKLKHYGVIACNQWATIDYRAGRETRAPRIVRVLRLESIRRLVSDPRKNWSKFWVSFRMMWEILILILKKMKNVSK